MRNGPLVTLPKVVNGMLSACLQNVDGMRSALSPLALPIRSLTSRSLAGDGKDQQLH